MFDYQRVFGSFLFVFTELAAIEAISSRKGQTLHPLPNQLWSLPKWLWFRFPTKGRMYFFLNKWGFPKIWVPPNHINHPFIDCFSIMNQLFGSIWGTTNYGNPHIYMWLFSYYRFLKTSFLHQFLSQTAWGNWKTSSRNGRTSVWSGCRRAWSWSAGAVVDRKVQECSVFWCPLSDLGCSISWRMIPTRHKGWKWVILLLSQFTLGSPCIWDVGSNPVLCGCWLWLWGMGQNSTPETDT